MRCLICGGDVFILSEYRTDTVRAPARECAICHALVLDEEAATSEEERDSVRLAAAARAACSVDAALGGAIEGNFDEEPPTIPSVSGRELAALPPR